MECKVILIQFVLLLVSLHLFKAEEEAETDIFPFVRSPFHHVDWLGKRYESTIHATDRFFAHKDAIILGKAINSNRDVTGTLLSILTARTNLERQQIKKTYQSIYRKSLPDAIARRTNKQFANLMDDLLTNTPELLVKEYLKALKSSDVRLVTTILNDFWNEEYKAFVNAYTPYANRTFWDDLRDNYGIFIKQILYRIVDTRLVEPEWTSEIKGQGRKPKLDEESAVKKAEEFEDSKTYGEDYGDVLGFKMSDIDPFQLRLIIQTYSQKYNQDLRGDIVTGTSGRIRDLLLALYDYATDKPSLMADILHDAFENRNTDDRGFQRWLILRSEIDLRSVDKKYEQKYKRSLSDNVKQMSTGDYRKALLAILQGNGNVITDYHNPK
ncbi:unnamed protein product [Trichobilharzia szidati]|nr:unnamed protein product [Trichobilharzia szidati]